MSNLVRIIEVQRDVWRRKKLEQRRHQEKKKSVYGKKQEQIKNIVNKLFYPHEFISIRPDWLKNPLTGKNLEIDLYNNDFKLAIEIQGQQHYKKNDKFHLTEEQFENQKKRDIIKKELIKKNNIKLIEIPYYIPNEDVAEYIAEKFYDIHSTGRPFYTGE